jgi:putative Ca2+/H+ antiporter (TMEM165/GDT1 family)
MAALLVSTSIVALAERGDKIAIAPAGPAGR